MIENWVYEKLKKDIGVKRYNHSLGVMHESKKLAKQYGYPIEKAEVAGLLHDCGKLKGEINLLKMANAFGIILDNVTKNNRELIHSVLGEIIAQEEYNIADRDILKAIRFHTTGRENMGLLEKIVYVADLIEPSRNFEGVEKIRDLAYVNIDQCLLYAIDNTLKFIISREKLIHLDSIKARNQILIQKNME
ncbi:bis(5'-nucleosyl)-tetraphosphatase (symmetrical) YqeK [Schnuerera sp. xch1]|uniref:bis(5'-nucleosyl)-tetraphosphatase (symmetrical) YqeK n=1 Tax=Schnuerera sp. xch1 TaxID=2874283 RepID=UPI001CBB1EAE|nr:bis(5'-nucleosyl)-tetraphosphatase (symmetrical) YqeK [Schnuerera sp. xch1]MBZ2175359.1 bis(5'-nucleosyl)-tetraphosphatase (symmetrical) YqeK [Schnuerera sp. xch1]